MFNKLRGIDYGSLDPGELWKNLSSLFLDNFWFFSPDTAWRNTDGIGLLF